MTERRIAVVGDAHGGVERLKLALALVPEGADLLLLTGDLTADPAASQRQSVGAVLEAAVAFGAPVLYVPGNHDLPAPPSADGATNVDGRRVDAAGLAVVGLGGAGPARFGFPYEWDEDQAESRIDALAAGSPPDIWLCHTPPIDTALDRIHRGIHVGSRAVRDGLARLRPRLFVCGHIHEAAGVRWVDGVVALNAGAIGAPFAQTLAWVVTWDDGPTAVESRVHERGDTRVVTETFGLPP